jgi:hypothetical protein
VRPLAIAALLIVSAAGALRAQVVDTAAFPPVPSRVPVLRTPPDQADSGFGNWRRVPIERHDKTPAAWTLRAGDWDFLMGTPRAMDAMDSSRIIDTTLANCRRPLNISTEDSAKFSTAKPWAPFDSLADGRPVLVISIMPVLRNFTECGFKNLGRPAMIRRGMRFVTDYAYDPSRDPSSAVLVSRSRIVKATMLAVAPVMVMSRNGVPRQPTAQLRLYIPYDAIEPLPTGDMPQVELMIWTVAGGEPDHIPLPGNILHTMWWEYLRWRSVRLATRDKATIATPPASRRQVVHVREPSDDGLRAALRAQLGGHDADATSIMLERLTDSKLAVNDRRIALMSLASTFQADDDLPSAALVANELTSMDPCALSGTENPGGAAVANASYTSMRNAGAMLDHTRSGARCFAYKPGATFLRGLIPGYGQYKTWSHLGGLLDGTLTTALAVTSYLYINSGQTFYARYQAEKSGLAPRFYTKAVDARASGNLLAIGAAVSWIGSALEAEIQERVHASRLAENHEFWFRPIISVTPGSGGGASSLGGGLKFEFR